MLPDNINIRINFCPLCGEKIFDEGRKYLMEIQCTGQRDDEERPMMVFLDDRQMYEVKPGDNICFPCSAGFHNLKFKYKIRSRAISLLVSSGFVIKTSFNSVSGLIETNISKVPNTSGGLSDEELSEKNLTQPVMVSPDGRRSFDILLGEDEPSFEFKSSSGLSHGTMRIYAERCEFSQEGQIKKDITGYKSVSAVKKRMGAIELQLDGNVRKVYSIPKDIYNEVLSYLTNRVETVRSKG